MNKQRPTQISSQGYTKTPKRSLIAPAVEMVEGRESGLGTYRPWRRFSIKQKQLLNKQSRTPNSAEIAILLDQALREAIFQDNTAQLNMRLPPP